MPQRFILVVIASWFVGLAAADTPLDREKFFEERVRPLLISRCYECHGEHKQESSLRLDSRAAILRGGHAGPAAVPRRPDDSLVLQAVRGEIESMPPDNPLDDSEIEILERWVAEGLPWPAGDEPPAPSLGDQAAIERLAATHWSFKPLHKPSLPSASPSSADTDGPVHPIDAFLAGSLRDAGLTPAPLADRRTLLRRLTFDLIGLPPTAAEVAAFESDQERDAVEKVITRLLQSPHYGERWARHWLDVARYADSQDWEAQADVRYPFAYTYRDWVIQALNKDLPYDQFIRLQLAADFIETDPASPQLAALGYLTVGPRFRSNKLELAADQIDVVTRGIMGLTVTCARCHDHKYDPVSIQDYYSLYGVFASSTIPESFPEVTGPTLDAELVADFRRKLAIAEQAMQDYRTQLRETAITDLKKQLPLYLQGYVEIGLTGRTEIRGLISKKKVKETAMTPLNDYLVNLLRRGKPSDPVMGPWIEGLRLTEAEYQGQASALISKWTTEQTPVQPLVSKVIAAAKPATRSELVDCYAALFVDVLQRTDPDPLIKPVQDALTGAGGMLDLDEDRVVAASRLLGTGRRVLGDLEKAIGEVFATHPGAPPRAMVVTDLPKPIPAYVMLRGEPSRRGDPVERQFIRFLSPPESPAFQRGSGRLELAEHLVAPNNPLTARVMVNRVWAKYFGKGLVENVDDFGLRCPPPLHAELLDWLAASFMEQGWSLKWLHRTIVGSQAYQRTSLAAPDALAADPDNRYLARQNRRQLDLEAMRDAILATSDQLDRTIGGRSVLISTPPFSQRRTLYAYVDRVDLDPMLKTFDFASPTASASERPHTMIPQQALFLMNHPFVAQFARTMAYQVHQGHSEQSAVEELYLRLFQRQPTESETALALQFVHAPAPEAMPSGNPWSYGYGNTDRSSNDFTALAYWSGQAYQPSDTFPDPVLRSVRLTANGGNPMPRPQQAVIRRWTAPGSGKVAVTGKVTHLRDAGDGFVAMIVAADGKAVFQQHLLNAEAEANVESLSVSAGDTIEFLVHCHQNAASDAFRWVPVISGLSGELQGQVWDAASDFAGPPPPPMNGWEQLAQALMLTNEFHFLD